MIDYKKIEIADWALEEALKQGAQSARAELSCLDNLTVQCQDTEVSSLQQSCGCGLVLRLFVDGRYGSYSTNRLEINELRNLITNSIACTRLLTPDPDRTLPDPSRYYRASSLEENEKEMLALESFQIDDPNIDPVAVACQIAKPALGLDDRLIHLSTYLCSRSGWQYLADSQSFRGLSFCSNAAAYTTASLRDKGDSRPSDSWMEYAICLDKLQPSLMDLGKKALNAAQMRIGAGSIPTGHYNIAIEPVCLNKLLSPILEGMQDYNLHQKRSMLQQYSLGDQIVSPLLTLTEEPQRHGAYSACLFDFEGVKTQYTPLINNGRLCEWFISSYYAKKMQLTPHLSGPNVLCIAPGQQSRQEILDSLDNTILITGFLGGNCNDVTGDFSFGFEGQLYRHGSRVQGIAGMNLTGNILEFWKNLSHIANDVECLPDGYFPTLFFENIEIQ